MKRTSNAQEVSTDIAHTSHMREAVPCKAARILFDATTAELLTALDSNTDRRGMEQRIAYLDRIATLAKAVVTKAHREKLEIGRLGALLEMKQAHAERRDFCQALKRGDLDGSSVAPRIGRNR